MLKMQWGWCSTRSELSLMISGVQIPAPPLLYGVLKTLTEIVNYYNVIIR